VGTIEPLISRLRFALWHVAKQISPHLFGSKLAGLYPRNGFNVNRYAFFDPMVVFRHRGERQMDHLVRQCPVTVEPCQGSRSANRNPDQTTRAGGIGDAVMNARAAMHMHFESNIRDRILAVVGADGSGGALDPVH